MEHRGSDSRFVLAVLVAVVLIATSLAGTSGAYPRPGRSIRVDVSVGGRPSDGARGGTRPSITADGRFIAFESNASDLHPSDTNGLSDVFVRDTKKKTTELISRTIAGLAATGPEPVGTPGNGGSRRLSFDPAITADGRFVAFTSSALNLVPADTNQVADVFVFDRHRKAVERVSIDSDERQATSVAPSLRGSYLPSISDDGRYVAFVSDAVDLVDDDTNGVTDVFVRDRAKGTTRRVSVSSDGTQQPGCPCIFISHFPQVSISGNGRFVVFTSPSGVLVPGDTNDAYDVFVRDLKRNRTERISVASDGTEARSVSSGTFSGNDASTLTGFMTTSVVSDAISANGRYVVFHSTAGNLVPTDSSTTPIGDYDIFVHDRTTDRTERMSVASDGREVGGTITYPSISADGRFVSLRCDCPDGSNEGTEYESDGDGTKIYVYDRRTGAVNVIRGHRDTNSQDWGFLFYSDLSRDGRYVGYEEMYSGTQGVNLAAFRWDRGRDLSASANAPSSVVHVAGRPGFGRTGFVRLTDEVGDVSAAGAFAGADIVHATVAHRPSHRDLFLKIDVDRLPRLGAGAARGAAVIHGFAFEVGSRRYEVRIAALDPSRPEIGLFECIRAVCREVRAMNGGYGTVGESVVTSIPLDTFGSGRAVQMEEVRAFSALGSYRTGVAEPLDEAH